MTSSIRVLSVGVTVLSALVLAGSHPARAEDPKPVGAYKTLDLPRGEMLEFIQSKPVGSYITLHKMMDRFDFVNVSPKTAKTLFGKMTPEQQDNVESHVGYSKDDPQFFKELSMILGFKAPYWRLKQMGLKPSEIDMTAFHRRMGERDLESFHEPIHGEYVYRTRSSEVESLLGDEEFAKVKAEIEALLASPSPNSKRISTRLSKLLRDKAIGSGSDTKPDSKSDGSPDGAGSANQLKDK